MTLGFEPDDILRQASERVGASDFGPDDFREPLAILCRSLDAEANLSPEGREATRARLVDTAAQRLLLHEWARRHPEILEERVDPPVVIAGLPRTGTTMLYRMLSVAEGFTAPLFYEVAAGPPAFDWDFTEAHDARIPAAKTAVEAMMLALPELNSIYPFEALAPEESIFMYAGSFCSTTQQSSAYVPAYDAWFRDADKRPAYRYLELALQFLQWQRKRSGRWPSQVRWLIKTPDHLHGLDALLDVFPGAQIIQTHRDPLQTIPSICSFIRVLHSGAAACDDSKLIGAAWTAMFADSMKRVMEVRARHPEAFLDVWYKDTVASPRKVAEDVFAFIDRPLTDQAWAEMESWREANKREERPSHKYTLEEFGLTEDQVKTAFQDYRQRFLQQAD
jgi:hypothetical protein